MAYSISEVHSILTIQQSNTHLITLFYFLFYSLFKFFLIILKIDSQQPSYFNVPSTYIVFLYPHYLYVKVPLIILQLKYPNFPSGKVKYYVQFTFKKCDTAHDYDIKNQYRQALLQRPSADSSNHHYVTQTVRTGRISHYA